MELKPELESTVSSFAESMISGRLDALEPGKFGIILGEDLASRIGGVNVGDKVILISTRGRSTPAGLLPRLKRFTVVGIFNLNFYEYDNGLALTHLNDLAKLQRVGNSVSGLRLKTNEVFDTPLISRELRQTLGTNYSVMDWTSEYSNLLKH